jgi:hypothetical protein
MQATTTPTLAQPKYGALAALGATAILAAAVGAGALIGINFATKAAPAADMSDVSAYALHVQRSGEIGALTAAQRGLLLQRQGEINAGVAPVVVPDVVFTTPTGTTIVRPGGRDPMADFNSIGLSKGLSDHDLIRGSKGWYAYPPAVVDARDAYPAVPFVPAAEADGNTESVGISHR